jgi:hypothetical protein
VTNAALNIGAQSNNEINAFMPLLAFATGRRIGLLAYLQGTSIWIDKDGIVRAKIDPTVKTASGLTLTPYKTDESIGEFIIPRFVTETGFVPWAIARGEGFVFASAHGAEDPADCVSKRLQRLLEDAQVAAGEAKRGTAHGWRGQAMDRFGEHALPGGANRLQVGHALGDEHEEYKSGCLPTPDAQKIYEEPPDEGIDLSPFNPSTSAALTRGTDDADPFRDQRSVSSAQSRWTGGAVRRRCRQRSRMSCSVSWPRA